MGWGLARRSIAWLRADREAIAVLREARGLLALQGVSLYQPSSLGDVVADVSVEPLPGSPEWIAYKGLERRVMWRVVERDPWRALSLALTVPRRAFETVSVGVDPGKLCAISIVADGFLIRAWKTPCQALGGSLAAFLERIPHRRAVVTVGSGPGVVEAVSSLSKAGLEYGVADESWTTSRPALWQPLRHVKDRDLAASATIALTSSSRKRALI